MILGMTLGANDGALRAACRISAKQDRLPPDTGTPASSGLTFPYRRTDATHLRPKIRRRHFAGLTAPESSLVGIKNQIIRIDSCWHD